ncbi:hypothetical protein ACFLRX_08095 [Acidobacteriota bacterium]
MLKKEIKYLKPIQRKIRIDAQPERVWSVISSPGNLEYCHPFCESNPVDKWPGKGSVDYVHYYRGLKFVREFNDWKNDIGYELNIGRTNGRKSKVVWWIDRIDNDSSYLNIMIYPHAINRYPWFIIPVVYYFYIKPSLRKYLSSVLKGFQLYIMTDECVRKNQFGSHKWFST